MELEGATGCTANFTTAVCSCVQHRRAARGTIVTRIEMSPSRVALIVVGSALVATWLTAATMTRQVEPQSDTAALPQQVLAPTSASLGLAAEVQRLRARLGDAPVPRPAGRNPFELGAPTGVPLLPPPPAPLLPSSLSAAPTAPGITLAGIAENRTSDGPVRTAIVSMRGEVLLVGEGGVVGTRFVVERIGPTEVELRDLENETRRTLVLP